VGVWETSARLLRLLSLLQARRHWAGADLAERLGVTERTVRRDVERLRGLGYPVHATPGVAGGYRLGAGGALPPLLLDDEEAVAVAVGLRTGAGGTVAGIEEASVRALAKLEQVMPPRLRSRISALATATVPLSMAVPTVNPDTLTVIASACRDSERLHFTYSDRDGATSIRAVEPHKLVHTGRRWYLVAYDLDRDDWRTFRLDRLALPLTTGPRFTPRDPPDAAAYVSTNVSSAPYRYQARIRLHAPLATVAAEVPPTVGSLEPVDDTACVLTTGADSLWLIALHIGLMGFEFEVLEPPELVDYLRALAARLLRGVERAP
jgi:predicted DNA-binding transcriptional regulator YafY